MQDSDDYRALLSQYQRMVQQLEVSQREIRTIREQSENYQREILVIRNQSESGSAGIKFELESSKREVARLTQIIETLRIELENSKKQSSEVIPVICILTNVYFVLLLYLVSNNLLTTAYNTSIE